MRELGCARHVVRCTGSTVMRLQLQSCVPAMKPRRNRLARSFDGITFLDVEIE